MRYSVALVALLAAGCGSPTTPTLPPQPDPAPATPPPTVPPEAPAATLLVSVWPGSATTAGSRVWITVSVSNGVRGPYRYVWTFGDGAADTVVSHDTLLSVPHTYGRPGPYTIRVEATDGSDRAGAGDAEINIRAQPPPPPTPPQPPPPPPPPSIAVTLTATPNPAILAGAASVAVTFTVAATPANGAGAAALYEWDLDGDGQYDDDLTTVPSVATSYSGPPRLLVPRVRVTTVDGVQGADDVGLAIASN